MNHIKNPPVIILALLATFIVVVFGGMLFGSKKVTKNADPEYVFVPEAKKHICDSAPDAQNAFSCSDGLSFVQSIYRGDYVEARYEVVSAGLYVSNNQPKFNDLVFTEGRVGVREVWIYTISIPHGIEYEDQQVITMEVAVDKNTEEMFVWKMVLADGTEKVFAE